MPPMEYPRERAPSLLDSEDPALALRDRMPALPTRGDGAEVRGLSAGDAAAFDPLTRFRGLGRAPLTTRSAADSVERMAGLAGGMDTGGVGMIYGAKAHAGLTRDAFRQNALLRQRGLSEVERHAQTGAYTTPDGRTVLELSDRGSEIPAEVWEAAQRHTRSAGEPYALPLFRAFRHPHLYRGYPHLQDKTVLLYPDLLGVKASAIDGRGGFQGRLLATGRPHDGAEVHGFEVAGRSPSEAREALLEEILHAAQMHEARPHGTAPGADEVTRRLQRRGLVGTEHNREWAYMTEAGEQEATMMVRRADRDDAQLRRHHPALDYFDRNTLWDGWRERDMPPWRVSGLDP